MSNKEVKHHVRKDAQYFGETTFSPSLARMSSDEMEGNMICFCFFLSLTATWRPTTTTGYRGWGMSSSRPCRRRNQRTRATPSAPSSPGWVHVAQRHKTDKTSNHPTPPKKQQQRNSVAALWIPDTREPLAIRLNSIWTVHLFLPVPYTSTVSVGQQPIPTSNPQALVCQLTRFHVLEKGCLCFQLLPNFTGLISNSFCQPLNQEIIANYFALTISGSYKTLKLACDTRDG